MKKLIHLSIIAILLMSCSTGISQKKFISYQDFELAYNKNPDLMKLNLYFNLLNIMVLDSTKKQLIIKSQLVSEDYYNDFIYGIKTHKYTMGFKTGVKNIKEIFTSTVLMNKVFNCISDTLTQKQLNKQINYPIYIKDNVAIVTIEAKNFTDIYYFKLNKYGILQIKWIYGIIAD